MSQNLTLPVKQGDDFVGELETMDLSELKTGKQFMVSISQGDRSGNKFLCTALRGPFTFEEMCEAVGVMWRQNQHHAKVVICSKDFAKGIQYLDENTVDYIEAHFEDIITESMLDGVFDDDKQYTCRAGIVEDSNEENPLAAKKEEEITGNIEEDDL